MLEIDATTLKLGELTLTIKAGRRAGLIGRNGVGKSTLLRNMALREIPIPTQISILYVEQEIVGDDTSAIESVLKADVWREKLMQEEAQLNAELQKLEESAAAAVAAANAAAAAAASQSEGAEGEEAPTRRELGGVHDVSSLPMPRDSIVPLAAGCRKVLAHLESVLKTCNPAFILHSGNTWRAADHPAGYARRGA